MLSKMGHSNFSLAVHQNMGVSKNRGTPKSSILIGFSILNHPFWGYHYFWKNQDETPELMDEILELMVKTYRYSDIQPGRTSLGFQNMLILC